MAPGAGKLTADQLNTLMLVERVASALSTVGIITIMGTFAASRQFRNPIHRLIFINAFYNAFDITATMISLSGPAAGDNSALCQFQGFLMQMFPVADVMWTFVMAVDVYLIVFRRYDAASLRKLEIKYTAVITFIAFIPAFVFLFIRTAEKGPFYGSVTLWCAIAPNWVLYRIVIYYVPIWTLILITMILYLLIGVEIIKRRRELQSISNDAVPLDDAVGLGHAATDSLDYTDDGITTTANSIQSQESYRKFHHRDREPTFVSDRTPTIRAADRPSLSFRQYILMPLMIFVVLLSIWVTPSTNRIASFINPDFLNFPLLISVGLTGSLRGFWNALVFVIIGMKARKRRKGFERHVERHVARER